MDVARSAPSNTTPGDDDQRRFGYQPFRWYAGAGVAGHRALIDPWSGNLSVSALDLPGIGGSRPVAIQRLYNSLSSADGPLGAGWSLDVLKSVELLPNGNLLYIAADGSQYTFPNGSGRSFERVPGLYASARQLPQGGFEVRYRDGATETYSEGGALVADVDARGRALQITRDDAGRLVSLAGPDGDQVEFGHDSSGRVATITDNTGRQVVYSYDAGLLVSVRDRAGQTWKYSYGGVDGRLLTAVTDPDGRAARIEYVPGTALVERVDDAGAVPLIVVTYAGGDHLQVRQVVTPEAPSGLALGYRNGALVEAVDAAGNRTTFRRDASLNATAVTFPPGHEAGADPAQHTAMFAYDPEGRLIEKVETTGARWTYRYDVAGRLSEVVDARGNAPGADPAAYTTRISYDPEGMIDQVVEPGNQTRLFTWVRGELSTVTYPDGSYTGLIRDDRHLVGGIQDRLQHNRFLYRDDYGRVAAVTRHDGSGYVYGYDEADRLTHVVDPSGSVTEFRYDASGHLISRVDPPGTDAETDATSYTTSFERDGAGRLLTATRPDPAGGTLRWTFEYDGLGRLVAGTDAAGGRRQFTYDDRTGLVNTMRDAAGRIRTLSYDSNRQLEVQDATAGGRVRFERDRVGRLVSIDTSWGPSYDFERDELGRVLSEVLPSGAVRSRWYDPAGRVRAVTANDALTRFAADEARSQAQLPDGTVVYEELDLGGNLVRLTRGGEVEWLADYDRNGRLIAQGTSGQATVRRYDLGGNLVRTDALEDVSGLLQTTTASYDPAGNRVERVDDYGTTTWEYDPLGRLTRQVSPDPSGRRDALETTLTYGTGGRTARASLPDGRSLSWSVGADGLLQSISDGISLLPAHTVTLDYTAGELTDIAWLQAATGQRFVLSDDVAGRVVATEGRTALGVRAYRTGYGYDDVGRLASLDSRGGSLGGTRLTAAYDFDALGRLSVERWTIGSATLARAYAYDGSGRLHEVTDGSELLERVYDSDGRLVTATRRRDGTADVTTFEHDDRGVRTAMVSGGTETRYEYDPSGRLARVLTGLTEIAYGYDGDGQLVVKTVTSPDATTVRSYHYLEGNLESVRDGQGRVVATYTVTPEGRPLVVNGPSGTPKWLLHLDPRGDVHVITDPAGVPVSRHGYDAWGNPLGDAPVTDVPFRKAASRGVLFDPDVDLYHIGDGRYFDPAFGEMINPDPRVLLRPGCHVDANCAGAAGAVPDQFTDHPHSPVPVRASWASGDEDQGDTLSALVGEIGGSFQTSDVVEAMVADVLGELHAAPEALTILSAQTSSGGPVNDLGVLPISLNHDSTGIAVTPECVLAGPPSDPDGLVQWLQTTAPGWAADYGVSDFVPCLLTSDPYVLVAVTTGGVIDPPVQTWLPRTGTSTVEARSTHPDPKSGVGNCPVPCYFVAQTARWTFPWRVSEYRRDGESTNRTYEHQVEFPGHSSDAYDWTGRYYVPEGLRRGEVWDSNLPNAYLSSVDYDDDHSNRSIGTSYGYPLNPATTYYMWQELRREPSTHPRLRLTGKLGRRWSGCGAWAPEACVTTDQSAIVYPRDGGANPGSLVPHSRSWRTGFVANDRFNGTTGWVGLNNSTFGTNCGEFSYRTSGFDAGTGSVTIHRITNPACFGPKPGIITNVVPLSTLSPAVNWVPQGATHAVELWTRCPSGDCRLAIDLQICDNANGTSCTDKWRGFNFRVNSTTWSPFWLQFPAFRTVRSSTAQSYWLWIRNGDSSTGFEAFDIDIDVVFLGYGQHGLSDCRVRDTEGPPSYAFGCNYYPW